MNTLGEIVLIWLVFGMIPLAVLVSLYRKKPEYAFLAVVVVCVIMGVTGNVGSEFF